jgi:hypothetical protein
MSEQYVFCRSNRDIAYMILLALNDSSITEIFLLFKDYLKVKTGIEEKFFETFSWEDMVETLKPETVLKFQGNPVNKVKTEYDRKLYTKVNEFIIKRNEVVTSQNSSVSNEKVQIQSYTDKSFVVLGRKTKEFKDELKIYGRFNPHLKCGPGWIFSNRDKDAVEKIVNRINGVSMEESKTEVKDKPVEVKDNVVEVKESKSETEESTTEPEKDTSVKKRRSKTETKEKSEPEETTTEPEKDTSVKKRRSKTETKEKSETEESTTEPEKDTLKKRKSKTESEEKSEPEKDTSVKKRKSKTESEEDTLVKTITEKLEINEGNPIVKVYELVDSSGNEKLKKKFKKCEVTENDKYVMIDLKNVKNSEIIKDFFEEIIAKSSTDDILKIKRKNLL